MSMDQLIKRLEVIVEECSDKSKNKGNESKDAFTNLRRTIQKDIKKIMDLLDDRQKNIKHKEFVVVTSSKIRQLVKDVKINIAKLEELSKKNDTEKKMDVYVDQKEIIDLLNKHVNDCSAMEKMRYGDMKMIITTDTDHNNKPLGKLPDLDDADFIEMKGTDKRIDDKLDIVFNNLKILREQANEMGKEIDKQEAIIENANNKAEAVTEKIESLNARMKKTLQSVRSGDKFIIDFILICILLGIGAHMYFLLVPLV